MAHPLIPHYWDPAFFFASGMVFSSVMPRTHSDSGEQRLLCFRSCCDITPEHVAILETTYLYIYTYKGYNVITYKDATRLFTQSSSSFPKDAYAEFHVNGSQAGTHGSSDDRSHRYARYLRISRRLGTGLQDRSKASQRKESSVHSTATCSREAGMNAGSKQQNACV